MFEQQGDYLNNTLKTPIRKETSYCKQTNCLARTHEQYWYADTV